MRGVSAALNAPPTDSTANLFFDRDDYDPGLAYGQSKIANSLFALEAGRRWAEDGIIAKAVMPGGIWTNLQRHWNPDVLADMKRRYPSKTPSQGAATSVFVATSPSVTSEGPVYFEDCHPAEIVTQITDGVHGVMPHALDRQQHEGCGNCRTTSRHNALNRPECKIQN